MPRRYRRHRLLVLVSAVALLGIILFGAMKYTSRSDFCARCHEMKPMYSTWQASRHARVACIKCHAEPGAAGFVRTKVKALGEVYHHFTGTYQKPITIETENRAFSDRCLKCHEKIKGQSKPHNPTHFSMDMACTSCHRGLVHDQKHNRRLPGYDICMKCHVEEMREEKKERQE